MKPRVFVTRRIAEPAIDRLREFCEVAVWDQETPPPYEILLESAQGCDGLLTMLTDRIDQQLIESSPHLKVISQYAVGYDNINVQAARERGIRVGNAPGVLTDATADFAFLLMMAAARRLGEAMQQVKDGGWKTWAPTALLGYDVWGATMGIIGFGEIGQAMARRAKGFDMRVLYTNREAVPALEAECDACQVSLDTLLRESDFISLHVDLNPETHHLIDADALAIMKPSAVLVNTARGQVVDQDALYHALKTGKIAAAALDVTDPEPLLPDHPLLALPNVIVAPHIASGTIRARAKMADMAVDNLLAGLTDKPLPYEVHG